MSYFTELYLCQKCGNMVDITNLTHTVSHVKCLNVVKEKVCNGSMKYIGNKK